MRRYNGKTAREWYHMLSDDRAMTFKDVVKWEKVLHSQYGIKDATELAYKLILIELSNILCGNYDEGLIAHNVGNEMRNIAEGTDGTEGTEVTK